MGSNSLVIAQSRFSFQTVAANSLPLHTAHLNFFYTFSITKEIEMNTDQYYQYSNKTLFAIKSDAERYAWAGYYLFVIISSLVGDTTILIASLKYGAIKLHRVIVVIIQHIALCDLLVTLSVVPTFVSIISDEWVLGNFLRYMTTYTRNFSYQASLFLICNMTTSKLLLLKYPFRFRTVSVKTANMICGAVWMAALILPFTFLLIDNDDIYFSYIIYGCEHSPTSNMWDWLEPLLTVVLMFIPNCLVVATTVYLLIIAKQVARRGRKSLKWQGIMTTVLSATVYCISVLPYFVTGFGKYVVTVDDTSSSSFNTSLDRIAYSFIYLNTISNFYIYSLSVQSFRRFIFSRIQLIYQTLTSLATSARQGM